MRSERLLQRHRPLHRRKRPGFFRVERPDRLWRSPSGTGALECPGKPMGMDERPRRVLIADDDDDTRTLISEMLADEPSLDLVGAAKDADEAIELAAKVEPDVAVLDWLMPGGGGGKAARAIKAEQPSVAIIALTGMDASQASYDMMSAGALGFLEKGCSAAQLIDAIRSVTRF